MKRFPIKWSPWFWIGYWEVKLAVRYPKIWCSVGFHRFYSDDGWERVCFRCRGRQRKYDIVKSKWLWM